MLLDQIFSRKGILGFVHKAIRTLLAELQHCLNMWLRCSNLTVDRVLEEIKWSKQISVATPF